MVRTIVVSWIGLNFRAAPDDAAREHCAAPHAASGERCAAPYAAARDQRAALGAVSYWMILERPVFQRLVLDRLVLERLVLERFAMLEPRHLTWLAWWLAPQSKTRRLVRGGKTRLDARLVFRSLLETSKNGQYLARSSHQRLPKMNTR